MYPELGFEDGFMRLGVSGLGCGRKKFFLDTLVTDVGGFECRNHEGKFGFCACGGFPKLGIPFWGPQ